ncbi:MAG: sulfurtransferase TusA family protein [Gammaproteobacteria bacterium]|nr:sulfurtransferase TusA family protein [Gammaproteobacteria bacterium]
MKQRLNSMPSSAILLVITTDSASVRDFSVFLNQVEHSLIKQEEANREYRFWIRKGSK